MWIGDERVERYLRGLFIESKDATIARCKGRLRARGSHYGKIYCLIRSGQ